MWDNADGAAKSSNIQHILPAQARRQQTRQEADTGPRSQQARQEQGRKTERRARGTEGSGPLERPARAALLSGFSFGRRSAFDFDLLEKQEARTKKKITERLRLRWKINYFPLGNTFLIGSALVIKVKGVISQGRGKKTGSKACKGKPRAQHGAQQRLSTAGVPVE